MAKHRLVLALIALDAVVLVAVILGATRPFVVMLARPLVQSDRVDQVDAIALLGHGTHADGTPSPATAYCLLHGIRLLRREPAIVLILSGGSHRGSRITDADAMAEVIRRLEIPPPTVVLDRDASSLVDHARAVATIARQHGLRTVAVVSPPLRSRRTALAFRRAGVPAVVATGIDERDLPWVLFVGRDDPLGRLTVALEAAAEYAAIGVYRLRGWI